jgi:CHAT domain-containing protein
MSANVRFSLDWYAGPSAEIEVFASHDSASGAYQLRYTPPFRQALRPPLVPVTIEADRLNSINQQIEQVAAPGIAPEKLQLLGDQLLTQLLPTQNRVELDLRLTDLFLELGLDGSLQAYPWELVHDGSGFLCLKHPIGRFVSNVELGPGRARETTRVGGEPMPLSVLLIAVPKPRPRTVGGKKVEYPELPEVETEAKAVLEALTSLSEEGVEYLPNDEATYDGVYKRLRKGSYHIVHYCGHAYVEAEARRSGLVLVDGDLSADEFGKLLGKSPPVCCFINACDTARAGIGAHSFATFGLARAVLESGAYLIGTRWKVADLPAAHFAREFYAALLDESQPLGLAVRNARLTCLERFPNDPAWASYVLYGDPRLFFRKANIGS